MIQMWDLEERRKKKKKATTKLKDKSEFLSDFVVRVKRMGWINLFVGFEGVMSPQSKRMAEHN